MPWTLFHKVVTMLGLRVPRIERRTVFRFRLVVLAILGTISAVRLLMHPSLPSRAQVKGAVKAVARETYHAVKDPIMNDRAIEAYRKKVKSIEKPDWLCFGNKEHVDLTIALSCLQKTTRSLKLEYPDDADAHFNEIRMALAPWAQHSQHKTHWGAGYGGPWIENYWISHFETLYDMDDPGVCLSDLFGPFIPLFIPWVDLWVNRPNKYQYPDGLAETLRSVLRPNVPYITVSQNDDGLPGRHELLGLDQIPNVLVLSAGGYGHVPIPLFKQEEPLNNLIDVQDRTWLLSYVGSLRHSPHYLRERMNDTLTELARSRDFSYKYYYGGDWKDIMADSRFSLAPRGFGRTAYHVVEALQMGLVPVHVYSDVPWVPYAELFRELGFSVHVAGMEVLVDLLQRLTADEIREREERIVSLRDSHFSLAGTMQQIELFMTGKNSDLRCQNLPDSIRDG